MSTDILPFQFESHEVRALTINGEPWFVLGDLANVLEIREVSRLASRISDDLRQTHPIPDRMGRTQNTTIVNEAGMYEVVLRSDKPEAVAFRRWLTTEVLPAIRKHGGYLTPEKVEEALLNPDTIIKLATELKTERAKRAELELQARADKPKVIFADAVSASHGTILVGELAKIMRGNGIEIGQQRLFQWMRENGYLIRRKGSDWNMPTQYAMERGWFEIKETAITHSDGHVTISKTPKVTGKGQQFFINLFLSKGAA